MPVPEKRTIFEKEYSGESLVDIYRDVSEAVDSDFTPEMKEIPADEWGMAKGTFRVLIEWIPDDEDC